MTADPQRIRAVFQTAAQEHSDPLQLAAILDRECGSDAGFDKASRRCSGNTRVDQHHRKVIRDFVRRPAGVGWDRGS